jgi:restriction system protein
MYVESIPQKVVLIDGKMLAQMMIDYDVGVSKTKRYDLKKIDSDYFIEE